MNRSIQRVLLVEDHKGLLQDLKSALERPSWEMRTAASCQEAIAQLSDWTPDFLILDVDLGDGTAFDVLKSMEGRSPAPMTVVISGEASASESFSLATNGVRAYFSKPLDPTRFPAQIDALLTAPPLLAPHVRALVGHRGIHDVEEEVREIMISEAIAMADGSKKGAAKLLRVSRQLIQHMVKKIRDNAGFDA